MDECRVECCGKIANLDGLCILHRRKDVAGLLQYEDGLIWDTCSKGHRWTPENTHIESSSKGGKRRRCKQCLKLKAQRKREEDPIVSTPEPVRLADPVMRDAYDTFDDAQEHIDGKCKGNPAPYADYTGKNMPTDVEAAKLCAGCPMLEACANNAVATRPGWGVWGGQVWVYGNPWDGDKTRLDIDD